MSRTPSPYYRPERVKHVDYETQKKLERLKILEQEKAEEEAHEKYRAELEIKKAKEQLEAEKKKDQAKKAVEDWQREQDIKKAKERKEKEDQEKLVEERVRQVLLGGSYTSAQLELASSEIHVHDRRHINETRIDLLRPTYIKVHKKHLLPETLEVYGLPWSWDVSCLFFQPNSTLPD
jgi:hypothetical protein